jgi:PiT family inorganic phosphate transporter
LLSSAAFSLGHGGADSQKVMGIICAALLVYGNMAREGKLTEAVPQDFKITELVQIEFENKEGKKEKFKPEVAEVSTKIFYKDGKNICDAANNEIVYANKKINKKYSDIAHSPELKAIEKNMHKIEVYMKGDTLFDAKLNAPIFIGKKIIKEYKYANIFDSQIDDKKGELLSGHKIKTKVQSETMPFWIAFGCYLMIGLGTLMGGWKIVKTMGTKITKVTPLEGVCAETAGALTLFTVSNFGIPVSTTHTITGSIIGVGATKRLSAVRWGVTINLLWAWILTIPVSGLLAALIYFLITLLK